MHFARLRLTGFKSFVDPTELHIEPGLTGIVGPNGCGKSNLLEALRWVMGENRARSMRGSGMSDVIFAGTGRRSARNMAEVALFLDNRERQAPAQFNGEDDLEVSRRIERDSGSVYRVNGKDVRQKDVQLLFADAATGAHSPAMVGQGRIGALINAKPQDRRAILEEAAGISGLYSRRHEAELRLKGAEGNLLRVHDVLEAMEAQATTLKRQSRQAVRYKEIAGDIERLEAIAVLQKWVQLAADVVNRESALRDVLTKEKESASALTEISARFASLQVKLETLREADSERAAALQGESARLEAFELEGKRRNTEMETLRRRREETERDLARERGLTSDGEAARAALKVEQAALADQEARSGEDHEALTGAMEEATAELKAREEAYESAHSAFLGLRAQKEGLNKEQERLQRQKQALDERMGALKQALAALAANDALAERCTVLKSAVENAEKAVHTARGQLDICDENRLKAEDARGAAQAEFAREEARHISIREEHDELANMLEKRRADSSNLALSMRVKPGFERAVAAVFLGSLEASLDAADAAHWRAASAFEQPSMAGTTALRTLVEDAPAVFAARLSHSWLIEGDTPSEAQLAVLKPGYTLVSQSGALWRWDGYTVTDDRAATAARWLERQNRLDGLARELRNVEKATADAKALADRQHAKLEAAKIAQGEARSDVQTAEKGLAQARRDLLDAQEEERRQANERTRLEESLATLASEQEAAAARLAAVEKETAGLPGIADLETARTNARTALDAARTSQNALNAKLASLHAAGQERRQRQSHIARDLSAWDTRLASADARIAELTSRDKDIEARIAALAEVEEGSAEARQQLLDAVEAARQARATAAESLHELTMTQQALAQDQKTREAAHGTLREERARVETQLESLAERRQGLTHTIREQFGCVPDALAGQYDITDEERARSPEAIEDALAKVRRERDRLGAVNLRAGEELEELEVQLGHLRQEKEDLEHAIHRLRGAIGSLNREGRERLLAAFDQVNSHFATLFHTLFGGGEAYLELTESDDPLEAGLEIYASPPGKKLQSLSLLSGGEQALTATSLIFAVFMTNPAPICVLDEVDAPLDDANVERFCNLLEDMVARTRTRFLIVTHNAVTMARMQRLYGVTMAERGVSTLVSVDLARAEELVDAV